MRSTTSRSDPPCRTAPTALKTRVDIVREQMASPCSAVQLRRDSMPTAQPPPPSKPATTSPNHRVMIGQHSRRSGVVAVVVKGDHSEQASAVHVMRSLKRTSRAAAQQVRCPRTARTQQAFIERGRGRPRSLPPAPRGQDRGQTGHGCGHGCRVPIVTVANTLWPMVRSRQVAFLKDRNIRSDLGVDHAPWQAASHSEAAPPMVAGARLEAMRRGVRASRLACGGGRPYGQWRRQAACGGTTGRDRGERARPARRSRVTRPPGGGRHPVAEHLSANVAVRTPIVPTGLPTNRIETLSVRRATPLQGPPPRPLRVRLCRARPVGSSGSQRGVRPAGRATMPGTG